jgi:hypothetical protein
MIICLFMYIDLIIFIYTGVNMLSFSKNNNRIFHEHSVWLFSSFSWRKRKLKVR